MYVLLDADFIYFSFKPLVCGALTKTFDEFVGNALWRRQPEAVHLLDMILKKHKPDFISLFKNPVGDFLFFAS